LFALTHNGLINVPAALGDPSIYWLRLYSAHSSSVVVVTEVPGNPGQSVTNAIERVADFTCTSFSLDPVQLVLFEMWPKSSRWTPSVKRVVIPRRRGTQPAWIRSSRAEIEQYIGRKLSDLPLHDALYAAVRALGGGVLVERRQDTFTALPVEELPPPHSPSRCDHASRFRQIASRLVSEGRPTRDISLAAGREFLASLSPADLQSCARHRANWKAIGDISAAIIDSHGQQDRAVYLDAARRSLLASEDRELLMTLFVNPIVASSGACTDGQHRACALRFSGAARAAVVTGTALLETVYDDWTYEGDG